MIGNVWEWCWDWKAPLPSAARIDPVGPQSGHGRVIRGGAWNSPVEYCTVISRNSYWPKISKSAVGFRVVKKSPVILDIDGVSSFNAADHLTESQ